MTMSAVQDHAALEINELPRLIERLVTSAISASRRQRATADQIPATSVVVKGGIASVRSEKTASGSRSRLDAHLIARKLALLQPKAEMVRYRLPDLEADI